MDECEPALMGKNLTGVKDSYIMLYIYKRQNVLFFLQTKFARFLSGPQVQNIISLANAGTAAEDMSEEKL